ncbi:MAG TPA: polyphosphate kinase 2, partial [Acidimicrobiales bacterium]|nr:polyphosphate kinase 2 [Acidimicrobiales bacterium]
DEMFYSTDTKQSPWFVVESDDKRAARLNCIAHLLSLVPYEEVSPPDLGDLPPRPVDQGYVRPPLEDQTHVPQRYR